MENKDFNKVLESVFGQEDQVINPELLAIAMTEQITYDIIHKSLFGATPTIPTYALCSLYDKGAFGKEITLEKVIDSIFKFNEIDEKDAFFCKSRSHCV